MTTRLMNEFISFPPSSLTRMYMNLPPVASPASKPLLRTRLRVPYDQHILSFYSFKFLSRTLQHSSLTSKIDTLFHLTNCDFMLPAFSSMCLLHHSQHVSRENRDTERSGSPVSPCGNFTSQLLVFHE